MSKQTAYFEKLRAKRAYFKSINPIYKELRLEEKEATK